jgi:cell envelope opacity-associated protein A
MAAATLWSRNRRATGNGATRCNRVRRWRSFSRDNNLPVNEVFAMAQVEGNDKPLSNMKTGQEVRIERDAQRS